MRTSVPMLAGLLVLAACDRTSPQPQVSIEDAVVTLPAVPGRPGAAYFVLRTNRDPTRLTGISSPGIGRIELHETVMHDGVGRMRPLRNPTFSPDAPLTFESGGCHAMLFEIDARVRAGGTVRLAFTFDSAPPATVDAPVRGPGDGSRASRDRASNGACGRSLERE